MPLLKGTNQSLHYMEESSVAVTTAGALRAAANATFAGAQRRVRDAAANATDHQVQVHQVAVAAVEAALHEAATSAAATTATSATASTAAATLPAPVASATIPAATPPVATLAPDPQTDASDAATTVAPNHASNTSAAAAPGPGPARRRMLVEEGAEKAAFNQLRDLVRRCRLKR